MKTTKKNQRGMTLVLALFVIVILTVLIVAVLVRSQNFSRGSKLHSNVLKARQLGYSAMGVVSARIQEATATQSGQAWASQPGAIQVYGADGKLSKVFKLYSASSDTSTDAVALTADLPPANWSEQPNLFVDLNAPVRRSAALFFPIVDPRLYTGNVTSDPEGFSYSNSVAGTVLPSGGASEDQRLPMPVQWLYVLSNGSLAVPESDSEGMVTIPGAGPNAEIIGRVAFWTDDETSKVNVNTAAGGQFWDTPRINSDFEHSLADSQPVQGEFQRYPGHPATVDLRAVFPGLSLDDLYKFVPKIQTGGSNGGTVLTTATTKPPAILPDPDRLFASTGEARYKPDHTEFAASSGTFGSFSERAGRGGFLLTANSRSPELNLFGRPRVAIWPIASNSGDRSSLDKLIAFCATTGVNGTALRPYYFQRQDASSPTEDYTNISNNKDLLAYLRKATGESVPGFGGSFQTKYGDPVRDQILTEIFDYVRGATNLKDPLGKKFADPNPTTVLEAGEGQVAPIRIDDWGTRGFGRFITVGEAFFWFTWQGQGKDTTSSPAPTPNPDPAVAPAFPLPAGSPADDTVQVQAIFALQFIGAAAGYSEYTPNITVKIEGLDQFTLNGIPMGFPATGTVPLDQVKDVPTGAIEDFRCMVRNKVFSRDESASNRFPFYSNMITIPRTGSVAMAGTGSPVTISIYAGSSAVPSAFIQKITLQIPVANITAPKNPTSITPATARLWGTGSGVDRFTHAGRDRGTAYMNANDRTRSMVSTTGDHRLTAAAADVPSSFFQAHMGNSGTDALTWTRSNVTHASSLQTPLSYNGYGPNSLGPARLISGVTYAPGVSRPPVATHVIGKPTGALAWDWDTGIGDRADGPWINKPDEGSLGSIATGKGSYFGGAETGQPALDQTMFLPNRQVSSPAMFGSLPTGINPQNPAASVAWQTLLFHPDPAKSHPGNAGRAGDGSSQPGAPADYLLLDLFWMPVVEPYAISEPFSTAGKVNMNSRLVPFTNITRETALYAAMKYERLLALVPGDINAAKYYSTPSPTLSRTEIDVNETLKGFRQRFDTGGLFVSPMEISNLYLVPKGQTYAGAPAFWQGATATGDNVQEKPYANLLAKLTTKSNTYSVHVIAQALKKNKSGDAGVFGQNGDHVVSEWKGTFLIERFLDPNDSRLPDFAGSAALSDWNNTQYNADAYYQTRVLQAKEWR